MSGSTLVVKVLKQPYASELHLSCKRIIVAAQMRQSHAQMWPQMIPPTVTFSTQGAQDARPGPLGVEARPVRCGAGGRAECTSARSLKLGDGREESISPGSSRTSADRTLTARAVTKCGVRRS